MSARVREAMLERGVNQAKLARALSIAEATLSRWLNDRRAMPIHGLERIAAVLELPIAYFTEELAVEHAGATAPPEGRDAPAAVVDEPPPWVADMLAKMDEIRRAGRDYPVGHAGASPTQSPPRAEAVRPLLEAVGHGGLMPIEVATEDVVPRLYPGWICWIDPLATADPGAVVLVEVDGERLLRVLDADGRTLRSSLPGRRLLQLGDADVRLIGVGRLVQHEP